MQYTRYDVEEFVREHDVKFVRLAFCDIFGNQKNISVVPQQLPKAFEYGISFDASAVKGFMNVENSDLLLKPDPATMCVLPWRSHDGTVIRMFCDIYKPDGTPFTASGRYILKNACGHAREMGYTCRVGTECEFYLFLADKDGAPTLTPLDRGGYFDIYPLDRGENVRREICNTLTEMGLNPERSHHEQGPGQNEIDFRYSDALTAADNALTFQTVVKTVARRNGLYADFSPKPLPGEPGSGFHINISVKPSPNSENLCYVIAGILDKACEMTAFLNTKEDSYKRFNSKKAPGYVSWSSENRSQLVRIPAAIGEYRRAELRSPDSTANPYLAFALMIYAGLYGLENRLELPKAANINLYKADAETLSAFRKLPDSLAAAKAAAAASDFIKQHIPAGISAVYCDK